MMNFFKTIFLPPKFAGDEAKTHQAFLLHIIVWTLIAVPIPYVISVSLGTPQNLPRTLGQAAFGEIVNIFLLWLMRQGRVRAAAITQVALFWLFFTFSAVTGSNVLGASYLLGYSLVIVITGVLLGGRAAFLITLLSVLSGWGMLYGLSTGRLSTYFTDNPTATWVISGIFFPVIAVLQYLAERTLRRALGRAQQEIAERKRIEQQLQESLQEKEVLLKEVHHRVKNNMQVIVSMLNLQSTYLTDERLLVMLRESQNRVRSMALVHEQLYRSSNLAQIEAREYLQHLSATLFHSYSPHLSHIDLTVEAGEIALGVDTAIPCGLIVNELVSNALKHGFPQNEAGQVVVSLYETTSGTLELTVMDNGVGIPAAKDWRNTESLGMQLVQSLVKQLHGTIELTRLQPGTKFILQFPK